MNQEEIGEKYVQIGEKYFSVKLFSSAHDHEYISVTRLRFGMTSKFTWLSAMIKQFSLQQQQYYQKGQRATDGKG